MENVGQVRSRKMALGLFGVASRAGLVVGSLAVAMRLGCPHHPPPHEPDAGPDGPIDGPVDGPIDGPPSTDPSITAVVNEDGGHQIRQSQFAPIVITGANLAGATSVQVGALTATIDSNTATRIDATVFTGYGALPGPLAVTVTAAAGTTSRPDALVMTPYVMSPAATPGQGRGTYESPMHICDPQIGNPPGPDGGDTIEMLGGVHHCEQMPRIHPGVTVQGAADGSTVITGAGFSFSAMCSLNQPCVFRRLTFTAPLGDYSILAGGDGNFFLEDVVDSAGLLVDAVDVSLARYSFDGPGMPLEITSRQLTLADVTLRCREGGSDGIALRSRLSFLGFPEGGSGTIDGLDVRGCARALNVSPQPPNTRPMSQFPMLDIRDAVLVDNEIGLEMWEGTLTLRDSSIRDDAATPAPSSTGIQIRGGRLTIYDSELIGNASAGLRTLMNLSGGLFEERADVELYGVEIVGGAFGIDFNGRNSSRLMMRDSTVRDQTMVAASLDGDDTYYFFGSAAQPGGNALSVVSGVALQDLRYEPDFFKAFIEAVGTTLNGMSFAGQTLIGPVSSPPDYEIQPYEAGVQF